MFKGSLPGSTDIVVKKLEGVSLKREVVPKRDQRPVGKANSEEFEIACKLACWCIPDDESSWPMMSQIVQALEGDLDISIPHVPRSLQVLNKTWSKNISSSYKECYNLNPV
ncbi:hypothetical protein ZIOFF_011670 [Zingiber officinale]|uniref:Uncharacterized protein n=1 Tax=Zingiber officinale TaxID=94328 RepID=A0A8J5LZV5_ZINOF|nr:hypothetical protein ZIOFF_011670 [Zingiber officinale]